MKSVSEIFYKVLAQVAFSAIAGLFSSCGPNPLQPVDPKVNSRHSKSSPERGQPTSILPSKAERELIIARWEKEHGPIEDMLPDEPIIFCGFPPPSPTTLQRTQQENRLPPISIRRPTQSEN